MNLKNLKFGIEIETVGIGRMTAAQVIARTTGGRVEVVNGTPVAIDSRQRTWKAVHDGSLMGASEAAEIVSPVLGYDDIPTLQEVVRNLRRAGGKANDTCGIHIHVDASQLDGRALANLAKMVYKQEELIQKALGIQEGRLGRYTRPVSSNFIDRLSRLPRNAHRDHINEAWYGVRRVEVADRYNPTRYSGLNLHSVWYRGTIEFRWFEGTMHAGKVKAYIQFCLALVAKAANSTHSSPARRAYSESSAKYDFRCFLLRLGMIGEEFETARLHLLANLPGDAAFKRGRQAAPPPPQEETA